jgi:hypothetical protein
MPIKSVINVILERILISSASTSQVASKEIRLSCGLDELDSFYEFKYANFNRELCMVNLHATYSAITVIFWCRTTLTSV